MAQTGLRGTPLTNPLPSPFALFAGGGVETAHHIAVLGRTLIHYLVIEISEEQCIALESGSGHDRNSLIWVENGTEGLWSVMSVSRLI